MVAKLNEEARKFTIPNFLAWQLGYLQRCPMSLIIPRSLLSIERLSGSSERECKMAEHEFKGWCTKFRLRPNTLENQYANILAEWWDANTKDFFSTSAKVYIHVYYFPLIVHLILYSDFFQVAVH